MNVRQRLIQFFLFSGLAAYSVLLAGASEKLQIQFSHSLSASGLRRNGISPRTNSILPVTYTVVAARIDFPVDNNPFATGNGMFDTIAPHGDTTYLDAPPHDTAFFAAHLEFLQNYFKTVSNGKAIINTILLPNKATAPERMGAYAPPPGGSDNSRLANLVDSGWRAVAAANPQFHFDSLNQATTFFVLFHAGVGRDIDLSSTYGYNPQPEDLPSLYFSLNALQQSFGASYAGVPVDNGAFFITNTAVIPETESRIVNDSLLVLGTNSLIAASFGSWLGLPALYNTATGYTGIGSFGLEDIASILSADDFSGAFPPAPNAWEKMRLGWITPVELRPTSPQMFSLVASQLADSTDTTIARVSINAKEYFLLENRERNPSDSDNTSGIGIQFFEHQKDTVKQYDYNQDFLGFAPNDISVLSGELISCSNYDWAVPGSGILIWHVDENTINQYEPDSVNATGHTPGVYLMEADGTQSIGVPVLQVTGTYFVNQGYWGDPWYLGNQADTSYHNSFSDVSQPNARSNANVPSGINIYNFTLPSGKMNFTVKTGLTGISATQNFPQKLDGNPGENAIVTADIDSTGKDAIFLATPNSLLAWKSDGSHLIPNTDSVAVFASEPGIYIAPSIDTVTEKIFALSQQYTGTFDSLWLNCWSPKPNGNRATQVFRTLVATGAQRSGSLPTILNGKVIFAIDTVIYIYDESGNLIAKQSAAAVPIPISFIAASDTPSVIILDHYGSAITEWNMTTRSANWTKSINLGGSGNTSLSVGDMRGDGQIEICVTSNKGNIVILDHLGNIIASPALQTPNGSTVESCPSAEGIIFDALGDGTKEFFVSGASDVFAQTIENASLPNYPAQLLNGATEASVIASSVGSVINGADVPSLLFAPDTNGLIHALTGNGGTDLPGFPLDLATRADATPAATANNLYVATNDGYLYSYNIAMGNANENWRQYGHDARHTWYNGNTAPLASQSNQFFPAVDAFNWPNPVYNKYTHVRFYVSENATVHCKIVNLANELVEQLPDYEATGGAENEFDLHTDGIQSGIYVIRLEADAPGNTGVAFIKMAIVN